MRSPYSIVPQDRRPGFTLIELVAVLVLLSVLMAALTRIVPRFTDRRADEATRAQAAVERTARMLLDRLTRDLAAAESAAIDSGALVFQDAVAAAAGDIATAAHDDVRYAVEQRADRPCLVRTEHGQAELLCCGEFRLDIRSFADDGTCVELAAFAAEVVPTGAVAVPLTSWLELALRDQSGAVLAEASVIREPASPALLQAYEERR